MAILKPFSAVRPDPKRAARICELPYDVMSSAEARQLASGNPESFLHVSKPEIDLAPDINPYDPEVYTQGARRFQSMVQQGLLRQDPTGYFYLYRQVMGSHSQIGLVAAASCEDYLKNIIKKHEFTRPDKEDDRVRHIKALQSQTGPVFLTYRAQPAMDAFVASRTAEPPEIDFTAADGVRHSSWTIRETADHALIERAFQEIPDLYIADGHHRSAAAARIFQERGGTGASGSFLTVVFPHNQLRILPYNRVLKDLAGATPAALLESLEKIFHITSPGQPTPTRKHELSLRLGEKWISLRFRETCFGGTDPIDRLDVTLLQKHVLAPLFQIDDPRTSKRINFVGGIRGTAELDRLVESGEFACAFSMFPTSVEDLMTIADAGGIMPPKSTWFEPKLRDGMFCHMI